MLCPALRSGRLRMPHALRCCPQNRCSRRRSRGGAQPGRPEAAMFCWEGNRPCNSFQLETAHGLAGAYACVCALGLLIGCPLAITHLALEQNAQVLQPVAQHPAPAETSATLGRMHGSQGSNVCNSRSHLTNSMGAQLQSKPLTTVTPDCCSRHYWLST